uniref:Uncharacterized protein n=1 Tax=Aegilops tauschii TaxID=37682 RepID=M8B9L9_AEGTA
MQARLQASRAFLRSLFARTWCSDERCRGVRSGSRATHDRDKGVGVSGKSAFGQINKSYVSGSAAPTTLRSSIEREKLMEEEEHVRQRKSFSGVIKWRPLPRARGGTRAGAPGPEEEQQLPVGVGGADPGRHRLLQAVAAAARAPRQEERQRRRPLLLPCPFLVLLL